MSKAEILAELPNLAADERRQVLARLYELEEDDLLRGEGPTEEEKKLLDEALVEYEKDKSRVTPWRDVLHRIRTAGRP